MNYTVNFKRKNDIFFSFEDDEYEAIDMSEEEPSFIFGEIYDDNDNQIGSLRLYELYNDYDFYEKCDTLSQDCMVIASAICGKSGKVLKKYLPNESEYEPILLLDQISINDKYRNMGIGSNIIKNLMYMLRYQFNIGCVIFLCASDYESASKYGFDSKEYKLGCARLIAFYKGLGFKIVKNNIMVYSKK